MQAFQCTTYGKLQVLVPRIVLILNVSLLLSYFILTPTLEDIKTYVDTVRTQLRFLPHFESYWLPQPLSII